MKSLLYFNLISRGPQDIAPGMVLMYPSIAVDSAYPLFYYGKKNGMFYYRCNNKTAIQTSFSSASSFKGFKIIGYHTEHLEKEW